MTWAGSILGSLLTLAALAGAAAGQPRSSPVKGSEVGPLLDPEASQAPPPAPPLPAAQELISLDVKDVDIVDLLLGLAAQRGKNIVIGDDVKGAMSITLWRRRSRRSSSPAACRRSTRTT